MSYIRNIRFDKLQICCKLIWKYIYHMGQVGNDIFTMSSPYFMIYMIYSDIEAPLATTNYTINIDNTTKLTGVYIDNDTSRSIILLYLLVIMTCLLAGSEMYFRENENFQKQLYNNAKEFVHSLDPYRRQEVTKIHLFVNKLKDYEPNLVDMIFKMSQN